MNEEKIKILGFVGPSGCGKDTAARYLENYIPEIYHYVKLCTTRPQRNEEDNGYIFLDSNEFLAQVLDGRMLNAQEFRGWYYGLNDQGLDAEKINVLPMSNVMVAQMVEENNPKYNLKIIYILTPNKERLLHILNREQSPDCKEVCRRFLTDIDDYSNNIELWENLYKVIENKYNNEFFDSVVVSAATCFEGD
jgi:guanylate kinase